MAIHQPKGQFPKKINSRTAAGSSYEVILLVKYKASYIEKGLGPKQGISKTGSSLTQLKFLV